MKEKIQKIYTKDITGRQLYLSCFVFYLFFAFLQNSTFHMIIGSRPFNIASYLVVGILILKILLLDNYTIIQRSMIFLILLLSGVSWLSSKSTLVIVMMAFILGAQGVEFREIIEYYFKTTLIIFLVVVASSLLGIIKDLVFVVKGRAVRYSLGIVYPTDLAARVLYLLLAHAYLNFEKLNWKYYLSYFLIDIIVMKLTDARLSVICIFVMIFALMIAKHAQNNPKSMSRKLAAFYWTASPVLSLVAIAGTYFYDDQNCVYEKLNHILSGRLSYGALAFYNYHIPMFGQKIEEHGLGGTSGLKIFHNSNQGYFFIDSSYMRLLMIYGLIILLMIISIFLIISVRSTYYKDFALPAVLLIVAISCTVEQHLLELSYNPFLLALLTSYTPISNSLKGKVKNAKPKL